MLKRVVVRCHNRPQERPATLDSVGAENGVPCAILILSPTIWALLTCRAGRKTLLREPNQLRTEYQSLPI